MTERAGTDRFKGKPRRRPYARALLGSFAMLFAGPSGEAMAQRIENETAIFAALDKVTARISRLEVRLNQTANFGSLKITPRTCFSRQPIEPPRTTSFVEIDETQLDGKVNRIFAGWMFAESPGLNALEHAVFDIWLTGCQRSADSAAVVGGDPARKGPGGSQAAVPTPAQPPPKKRPPR